MKTPAKKHKTIPHRRRLKLMEIKGIGVVQRFNGISCKQLIYHCSTGTSSIWLGEVKEKSS